MFHHDPTSVGLGPRITADLLRDPLAGNYTVDNDRDTILPVLKVIAERYAEYAASGSDAWDATVDVHDRPQWPKDLVGVTEHECECPAVDPSRTEFTDLLRPYRPALIRNPVHDIDDDDEQLETTKLRLGKKYEAAQSTSKVHPREPQSSEEKLHDELPIHVATPMAGEAIAEPPSLTHSLDVLRVDEVPD